MRPIVSLMITVLAVACQRTPQSERDTSAANAGPTTRTAGAPRSALPDTPRAAHDSVPRNAQRSEVTLTLDRDSYAAGASASVRITSHSRDTLGYNPCSNRSVQRKEGTSWVTQIEPGRMCTMEMRLLRPGERQTVSVTLPGKLPAGTYRLELTFNRQGPSASGGSVRAVSSSFRAS